MPLHEKLLLRRAEAHEKNIRLYRVHRFDNRRFIFKIAVVHATDDESRVLFAHFFRRELGHAGLASEKVDASAAFGENPKESVCEIHARDFLL